LALCGRVPPNNRHRHARSLATHRFCCPTYIMTFVAEMAAESIVGPSKASGRTRFNHRDRVCVRPHTLNSHTHTQHITASTSRLVSSRLVSCSRILCDIRRNQSPHNTSSPGGKKTTGRAGPGTAGQQRVRVKRKRTKGKVPACVRALLTCTFCPPSMHAMHARTTARKQAKQPRKPHYSCLSPKTRLPQLSFLRW
jgi:hypothetical protein